MRRRRVQARPWQRDIGRRRVAGTLEANATALNGLTLSAGQLVLPAGSVGAPSLTFASNLSTGIYRYATSTVGVSTGGALNLRVGTTNVVIGEGNAKCNLTGGVVHGTVTTGGAWSSDTTDYDPGLNASILRVSSTTTVNWNSMINGAAGRIIWVHNVGANTITVVHQAGTGTASGKFLSTTAGNLSLGADKWLACIYDGTTSRWRVALL